MFDVLEAVLAILGIVVIGGGGLLLLAVWFIIKGGRMIR